MLFHTKAGAMFDNSFFVNCFELVQQCKNRSFYLLILLHKKVEIRINRTQSFPWSKLTLVKHKCCLNLVRFILISTFNFSRLGQVRLGQVRLGQVRLDQIRLGQVRLGQVRLGQVRLGHEHVLQIKSLSILPSLFGVICHTYA